MVIEVHPEAPPSARYAIYLDPDAASGEVPWTRFFRNPIAFCDSEEEARSWCDAYKKRAVVAEYPL